MDAYVERSINQLTQRVRVIEANIAVLVEHLGLTMAEPEPTASVPPEVVQLVLAGNKIEAIKRYRELVPCGLAEAKAVIDQI